MSAEVKISLMPSNYQTVVDELQTVKTEMINKVIERSATEDDKERLGNVTDALMDLGATPVRP